MYTGDRPSLFANCVALRCWSSSLLLARYRRWVLGGSEGYRRWVLGGSEGYRRWARGFQSTTVFFSRIHYIPEKKITLKFTNMLSEMD